MARKLDRILVVDVETTCWEGDPPSGQTNEIIEIGLCVLDVPTLARVEQRDIFVRPLCSTVSPYCTQLTTLTRRAELVEEIRQKGVLDFDVAVAHPSVMRDLSKIVKLLGPKGLMPNPKNETVTTDVAKTIKELAGGKAAFRAESGGNVHVPCAKLSQEPATIVENVNAFITALKTSVGSATVSLTLSTTMGPGVKISL